MRFRILKLKNGLFIAEHKKWFLGRWEAVYSDGRLSMLPTKLILATPCLANDIIALSHEQAIEHIRRAKKTMTDNTVARTFRVIR